MRTFTIGGKPRSRRAEEALGFSTPYRYQLCGGGRRVAVWLRDEEHDWRSLLFADTESGAVLDHFPDVAREEGGSIAVCQDGRRVVYLGPDADLVWHYRDETADAWTDVGPVDTRFGRGPDEDHEDDFPGGVYLFGELAASADGTYVVLTGTRLESPREPTERRVDWVEAWVIGPADDPVPLPGMAHVGEPWASVAVSSGPGEPRAALAGGGRVRVCDLSTGNVVADLAIPWKGDGPHRTRFDEVRFSADGCRLAACDGVRLIAWDTADWSPVRITLPGEGAVAEAVSPDGRTLATADANGVVRLWDAATGAAGPAFTAPGKSTDWDAAVGLSFSADGAMCLLGFASGRVTVWDVG